VDTTREESRLPVRTSTVAGASCHRVRPVRLSQSSEQDARATLENLVCGTEGNRSAERRDFRLPPVGLKVAGTTEV